MLLDNLFASLGPTGTVVALIAIVVTVGFPAAATVLAPNGVYCRLNRSGVGRR